MRYQNYEFQVPREKVIRVITDTDAKNEADDPFAVVHTDVYKRQIITIPVFIFGGY